MAVAAMPWQAALGSTLPSHVCHGKGEARRRLAPTIGPGRLDIPAGQSSQRLATAGTEALGKSETASRSQAARQTPQP